MHLFLQHISVFALSGVQTEEYDFLDGMIISPWHHIPAHHLVFFSCFPVFPVFQFSYFSICLYFAVATSTQTKKWHSRVTEDICRLFSVLLYSVQCCTPFPCTAVHCTVMYGRKYSKTQEGNK